MRTYETFSRNLFRMRTSKKHTGWGHILPNSEPATRHVSHATMFKFFLFILLRTLLHSPKSQLFSFQAIPNSLAKTPGGGVSPFRDYLVQPRPGSGRDHVHPYQFVPYPPAPLSPYLLYFLALTNSSPVCRPQRRLHLYSFHSLTNPCRHNGGGLRRHFSQRINMMADTGSSKPLTSPRSHLSLTRSPKQHTFRPQCAPGSSFDEKQTSPRGHFPFRTRYCRVVARRRSDAAAARACHSAPALAGDPAHRGLCRFAAFVDGLDLRRPSRGRGAGPRRARRRGETSAPGHDFSPPHQGHHRAVALRSPRGGHRRPRRPEESRPPEHQVAHLL